jgi:hypothetical protein
MFHANPKEQTMTDVSSRAPLTTAARQMCPLMSLDDARRVLRIRKSALYDLINDGTLEAIQRGRARYISDRALRVAIEKIEAKAKQA